jgi:hypothetical protein
MGQLIRFIPVTVVIGFTNGIAVVIFLAQIKDFFGLQIDNLPAEFFHRIKTLAAYAHTIDLPTLGLASACFVFLLSYNKLAQKIAILRRAPGPLAVLVVGTLVSFLFELPVETIGSRFNGIPQELPDFGLPELSIHDLGKLISPAITIALLGAIESLLSARVADSQIDDRHDPNQELVAQGWPTSPPRCSAASPPPAPSPARRPTSRPAAARRWPASSTPSCCSASSCSPRRSPPTFRSPPCRPSSWWSPSTWANGTSSPN